MTVAFWVMASKPPLLSANTPSLSMRARSNSVLLPPISMVWLFRIWLLWSALSLLFGWKRKGALFSRRVLRPRPSSPSKLQIRLLFRRLCSFKLSLELRSTLRFPVFSMLLWSPRANLELLRTIKVPALSSVLLWYSSKLAFSKTSWPLLRIAVAPAKIIALCGSIKIRPILRTLFWPRLMIFACGAKVVMPEHSKFPFWKLSWLLLCRSSSPRTDKRPSLLTLRTELGARVTWRPLLTKSFPCTVNWPESTLPPCSSKHWLARM